MLLIWLSFLYWLYLNRFLLKDRRFRWIKDGIHLQPAAIIILLSPFLSSHFWLYQKGYTFSLLLMGAYFPFCFYKIQNHFKSVSSSQQTWVISLTVGIALVWTAYTSNFLLGLVSYITAPVIFSFVMYFMTYLGLKQNNIFIQEPRYSNSAFTPAEIEQCFEKLQHLMVANRPYKDALLTLPKLARQLIVSPNLLSQAINEKAKMNLPDYINSYRIKEARQMLISSSHANEKIASIAFDTGFNTLSAFNAAFRKFVQMTPSEFRKKSAPKKSGEISS